jgi:hypothetical protein
MKGSSDVGNQKKEQKRKAKNEYSVLSKCVYEYIFS